MPATNVTYTTLLDDVRRYIERGSPADTTIYEQLPRVVNLAERRIAHELKILGQIVPMVSQMIAGTAVYAKPDLWRETVSMNYGLTDQRLPLWARSYEFCRSFWPDDTLTGAPRYYADYDDQHWLIAPTPAANYNYEVLAYEMPPLLSDDNQSNWLTEFASDLLFPCVMVETEKLLKNPEDYKIWAEAYDRALQVYSGEDIRKILDRAAKRRGA